MTTTTNKANKEYNEGMKITTVHGASRYTVDSTGVVRNKKTGREIKPATNGWAGYYQLTVTTDNGERRMQTVHRLVWESFNGAIPDGLEISHLDDNKANNALDNLALMSHRENCNHGARNSRIKESRAKKRGLKAIYAEQVAARRAAKQNGKEGR